MIFLDHFGSNHIRRNGKQYRASVSLSSSSPVILKGKHLDWHYNHTGHHHPTQPSNFSKAETGNSYSLKTQNFIGRTWIDTIIKRHMYLFELFFFHFPSGQLDKTECGSTTINYPLYFWVWTEHARRYLVNLVLLLINADADKREMERSLR